MSTADDTTSTAPKTTEVPISWETLREIAVKEGSTFSNTEIKPASLIGVYVCVWDSYTMLECMDDIGEEENWIKFFIKNPKNLENATFDDVECRFRWWEKENLWVVNNVTWLALMGVDDDNDENPWESDENPGKGRVTNGFSFASLGTVDGNPFFEMLYNTGETRASRDYPEYVKTIWKKHKEEHRGSLMLTEKEARRLARDGAADFRETRDFEENIEDIDGEDSEHRGDDDSDEDKDAEGDLEGESSQTDLKRRAGEDESGPEVKRQKL